MLFKYVALFLVMARDHKRKTHFVNVYVHLHMPGPSITAILGGAGVRKVKILTCSRS